MPKGSRVKQVLRKGAKGAQRALAPIARQAFQAGVNAAKQELKKGGRSLLHQVSNKGPLLLGLGDYSTNNLMRGGRTGGTPSTGNSTITIRRREPLGKIVSSTVPGAFKMEKFRVQPADTATFPWLQGIAGNYESWRPSQLFFEYIPTSGMSVASTDTALGTIVMAPQYNPLAVDPNNLQQVQGIQQSVSLAPFEHGNCFVECKPKMRQADTLLIRNANVTSDEGSGNAGTLFDLCEFFIASEGCQGGSVTLGQLFINYTITLLNPIVPLRNAPNDGFLVCSKPSMAPTTYQKPFGSFTAADTDSVHVASEKIGVAIDIGSSLATQNHIVLSQLTSGAYELTMFVEGTDENMLGADYDLIIQDLNTGTAYTLTNEKQYKDNDYPSSPFRNTSFFKIWHFDVAVSRPGPVDFLITSTMPAGPVNRFFFRLSSVKSTQAALNLPTQW